MAASSSPPLPRLVIAGASSDAGKTTVALGLIAALRRRGLAVAPFKTGPDFIDTAHLARAAGRTARNLDAWLTSEAAVGRSFARGSAAADLAVIEGAMGLFDGRHGSGDGSSAHVARVLAAPVLLVLDCAKASSTIGAIAFGLARFDPRLRIAGAILNRVASDAHERTVVDACVKAGVPVLGVLRRDERLTIPSRHLGLVSPQSDAWAETLDALAHTISARVDLDAVLAAAATAPAIELPPEVRGDADPVRIAYARDEAFWFYDEGSLDELRAAGAELIAYAPLRDPFPAGVRGAFIGGGYPESHAAELAANVGARAGLRTAIEAGLPVYAECGGLMYLSESLETAAGAHAMVGAVPARSTMSDKRSALRYVEAQTLGEGPMFAAGTAVRGHEFHYSRTHYTRASPAYAIDTSVEGFLTPSLHASYIHAHLDAQAATRFCDAARAFGG
jgi:cobyrinic acid a,c-diamide synthase